MHIENYLELLIVILAAWALWKSLPRPQNYDWVSMHSKFLLALSQIEHKDWLEQASREELERPFPLFSWDDISVVSEPLIAFLQRKCQHLILIGEGNFLVELSTLLARQQERRGTIERLSQLLEQSSQRFLFFAEGEQAQELLLFLHEHPAVRDHTAAVFFRNPVFQREWCAQHFNHQEMDVEAQISIPYVLWGTQEYTGLPEPEKDSRGWKAIEQIDLGVFSKDIEQDWMAMSVALMLCKTMEGV